MKKIKKAEHFIWVLAMALMLVPMLARATTTWTGSSGTDWNTAGNWSAGVPGDIDDVALFNAGGTIDVTAEPTGMLELDFRINTGSANANVVNWNPGAAAITSFTVLHAGSTGSNGSTTFNHQSGTIDMASAAGTYQFRVGNNNAATYNMSGDAIVEYIEGISIGQSANGNGNLIMNGSSELVDSQNGGSSGLFLIGNSGSNAKGILTMNDNASAFHRANVRVGANNGAVGTINMNNSARLDIRTNLQLGHSGEGHLVMGDASILRVGVGANSDVRVGQNASGRGTVTMSGNALIAGSGASDDVHIGYNGDGTLIMSGLSAIAGVREFSTSHNAAGSDSTVTMSGNSVITARTYVNIGRSGTSTLTLNDNASITNSENSPFNLAAQSTGNATLVMNGSGTYVHANQDLNVAFSNGAASTALFDQNAGQVFVNNVLRVGNGVVGNAGTYNLDGGTLRSNSIIVDGTTGVFNWGATLTVREVSQNASGNGSIIGFTGDLASSTGATLELNDLYESGGIIFDKLAVSGALDLSAGGDIFQFWNDMQRLRGRGGINTGELQLISATSVSGQFDNIVGPGPDGGSFFRTWGPGEIAQGTAADALQLNRGYLDYRVDGVFFVYKVSGQVPEPETGMLVVVAVLFLRGLSRRSWLVMLRQKLRS